MEKQYNKRKITSIANGTLATYAVGDFCFSNDGTCLFVPIIHHICVYETETGKIINVFTNVHSKRINTVRVSGNDEYLLTASDDHTCKLISSQTGAVIRTYTGHDQSVMHAEFGKSNTRIYSRDSRDIICMWDVDSGLRLRIKTLHGRIFLPSHDEKKLIIAEINYGRVPYGRLIVFDVETNIERTMVEFPELIPVSLEWTAGDTFIFVDASNNGALRYFSWPSCEQIWKIGFNARDIQKICVVPGGRYFFASDYNTFFLWRVNPPFLIMQDNFDYTLSTTYTAVSSNGKFMAHNSGTSISASSIHIYSITPPFEDVERFYDINTAFALLKGVGGVRTVPAQFVHEILTNM